MMTRRQTRIVSKRSEEEFHIIDIKIQRGIFNGDALSAQLFCVTPNPLSRALNDLETGYKLNDSQLTHPMHMGYIKLLSSIEQGLKQQLRFTSDVRMKFGLQKSKIKNIRKEKWHEGNDFELTKAHGNGRVTNMD